MSRQRLRDGIADQFSYRGDRSDIWRVFDQFLETDAFLNLGYSAWYQPHAVGSPQRRLATVIGRRLATHLPATRGVRLLDVGCGRGGPALELAEQFGFRVTGIDLVRYNVARARENGRQRDGEATFVEGDATSLPLKPGSVRACTAVDALVYLPDRAAVAEELATVLQPGGVFVFSDLVARADLTDRERRAVDGFASAWDMPSPATVPEYRRVLQDAGFTVRTVEDLSSHSVGRFRTWTTLFRWLHRTPAGGLLDRGLRRYDLDPDVIAEQIRRAHEALPALKHVLVVAKTPGNEE